MRNFLELSRRRFLSMIGATGLSRAAAQVPPSLPSGSQSPVAKSKVFNLHQLTTLEAIIERIIPADSDPGAREAGVTRYIERVLTGEQSEKVPLYHAGLEGADETSQLLYGCNFAQLTIDEQDAVLRSIERGDAPGEIWRCVSGQDFFSLVWNHVLEGFYGPPEDGGNKDYVSWKMVGFPEHSGTM